MTRTNDRPGTPRRDAAHRRAFCVTAIGLCLTLPSTGIAEAPGIQLFRAHPEPGSVLLTWTLPPVTTFSRIVIRYRIDGPAPLSPTDGTPLFDEQTPPGAMYGKRHRDLSPQHIYSYAAFALDAFGVVRASTAVVGTPLPLPLPATVQNLRRADARGVSAEAAAARSGQ
jgi:hypothetical protein